MFSLQTYSGLTYQGDEITARTGQFEEFYSLEYKRGRKSDENSGYFIYGGIAKYNGADRRYSPFIQGQDFDTAYGPFVMAIRSTIPSKISTARTTATRRSSCTHRSTPTASPSGRDTRTAAKTSRPTSGIWAPATGRLGSTGTPPVRNGYGYQQFTNFAGYKHQFSDKFSIELSTSVDVTEFELVVPTEDADGFNIARLSDSHSEAKWISKALLHWDPTPSQQVAAGVEYGYYWLGLPSLRTPGEAVADRFSTDDGLTGIGGDMPRWQTGHDLVRRRASVPYHAEVDHVPQRPRGQA